MSIMRSLRQRYCYSDKMLLTVALTPEDRPWNGKKEMDNDLFN